MQRNIADIITEICEAKVTGILSLSLNNDSSLFKVFFRDGTIYHITHSTCKDHECIARIPGHNFVTGLFMPGAQVDIQNGLPMSNQEIIASVRKAGKTIEWGGRWDGSQRPAQDGGIISTLVDTSVMNKMAEELLNTAGPVASLVLANAYTSCGLKEGQRITKTEFHRLVKTISGQLPDEHRESFLKKFV